MDLDFEILPLPWRLNAHKSRRRKFKALLRQDVIASEPKRREFKQAQF